MELGHKLVQDDMGLEPNELKIICIRFKQLLNDSDFKMNFVYLVCEGVCMVLARMAEQLLHT